MNREKIRRTMFGLLLIVLFLNACGPSQADLEATTTQVAAEIYATQTAGAPTITLTATGTPTITPTPTSTPTATPVPFVCEDKFGCVTYAPGDPIRLASALVISGPNTDLGTDSQYGVEVAIEFQGEILGHPIELVTLDDGCSAQGGEAAGREIVSDPTIVAVVGSSCSGAAVPMSKIITDAGYLMVSPSNTHHVLTDPDYHKAGYLRTAHNDKEQGVIMAGFAYNQLGVHTAAVIHGSDSYTEGLVLAFGNAFEALGGEIVVITSVSEGDTDMRPILTAVSAAGPPEFLYYPVFTYEAGFLTLQAREVAGLEDTILAAADGAINQTFINTVGEAGEGKYFSGPDLSFSGDLYDEFLVKYEEKYGSSPISVFHPHAFDATNMIFACIEGVATQDADGTIHIGRQALRDCLYATEDFPGITGSLTCDAYGDCGGGEFSISQIQDGEYIRIWP